MSKTRRPSSEILAYDQRSMMTDTSSLTSPQVRRVDRLSGKGVARLRTRTESCMNLKGMGTDGGMTRIQSEHAQI
ncbi:hypothetical protein C8Q74DRAFT_1256414 [Fomes fomentarius]|nr:hypothetical protein C8Q74DRAFT_1256414 [Fomes fomentarius]